MSTRPSTPVTASDWSVVDAAPDPRRLLASLDTLRAEPFFAQSKARLAERLRWVPRGRLVDIGCGTGDDAAAFAHDYTAIGIESSNTMCAEARARFPQLPVLVGDAGALPLPGGLGALDSGLIGALVLYGSPVAATAAAVLVYRGLSLAFPVVLGVIGCAGRPARTPRRTPARSPRNWSCCHD